MVCHDSILNSDFVFCQKCITLVNNTIAYTWDKANRMLTAPGNNTSYVYDGAGNRIEQHLDNTTIRYLNDTQPGLTRLLRQRKAVWQYGTSISHETYYSHGVRGILASRETIQASMPVTQPEKHFYLADGLGSIRSVGGAVRMSYDPYGQPLGNYGAGFGFTGEQTDSNGQIYLRARYYDPALSTFTALDPLEGVGQRPLSLNRYSWVEGNPVMNTDPGGKVPKRDEIIDQQITDPKFLYSCNCGWIGRTAK